jgi:hypothetical protein
VASKQKTAKRRAYITAIPLVLVNAVAFSGQFAYINDHFLWIPPAKVMFAIALESVALFLAYMAHQALMSEDSAYGLRLSSYAFGAVIGLMNYSHYAGPGMKPTFEAVATGLMSVASPWLWGIYSRRQSRDQLKAKGLIEPRAVKLGVFRWLMFPGRAWKVFRLSVWLNINRPDEAIAAYESGQLEALLLEQAEDYRRELEADPDAADSHAEPPGPELVTLAELGPLGTAQSKADAVRVALAELGESVTAAMVADWLSVRGWDVSPKYARTAIDRERERNERRSVTA